MTVKIQNVKSIVWIISIVGKYHIEKHYDRMKAMARARVLAGRDGTIIEA
jgi:hypothetical protein